MSTKSTGSISIGDVIFLLFIWSIPTQTMEWINVTNSNLHLHVTVTTKRIWIAHFSCEYSAIMSLKVCNGFDSLNSISRGSIGVIPWSMYLWSYITLNQFSWLTRVETVGVSTTPGLSHVTWNAIAIYCGLRHVCSLIWHSWRMVKFDLIVPLSGPNRARFESFSFSGKHAGWRREFRVTQAVINI